MSGPGNGSHGIVVILGLDTLDFHVVVRPYKVQDPEPTEMSLVRR